LVTEWHVLPIVESIQSRPRRARSTRVTC